MRIALFQPDIPQNTGAILRLGACLNLNIDIIGPAGFVIADARLKRAGLDYAARAALREHDSWDAFLQTLGPDARLLLLTTKGSTDFRDVDYKPNDILLMGRESAGVPDFVHDRADLRITIPLAEGNRSLNVAMTAAMVTSEALRQTDGFPKNS
ncbi:MAG: tRNA (cytidine(34)-2'-O)-methyltransferase [Rhodospirillales bacterium]|jgi:tRNA (cytidine/uridine-2'-O-)-methyltransferase|nr:tRNA (cytidine(34)-2'-O)-methyltransferase [Rhodospirillales bacterium]MBT4006885.1 tRNA (cytidine(34)-2'-O)-methyltransferase [Rhodospirillales bacterium]MBT5075450.1 tRNA (cytidine(34)-2'-O)-methyltransferase [Rhodospirillales bacterium]MBT5113088.1 tRNA (cytidine(34)-2'-O)-methyltransferase [Rhodospirillales bacterium]MBT5672964.1 tRNA (cytidine(34)-2'-O)-methyltransferase [Rhodospirillales bacterium]